MTEAEAAEKYVREFLGPFVPALRARVPDDRRDDARRAANRLTAAAWSTDALRALVAMAPEDREAWDACGILLRSLRSDTPVLPELGEFAAKVLSGTLRPPKRRRTEMADRDFLIVPAVGIGVAAGLKATRSAKRSPSKAVTACDVVADVLGIGYDAVEAVWKRRRKAA